MMTHAHSMRWLKIACLMTRVTGIACALASYPATDAGGVFCGARGAYMPHHTTQLIVRVG